MSNSHETQQNGPENATTQQAFELFKVVGFLTSAKGKNYGDRNTFGDKLGNMPEKVASHFTTPRPECLKLEDSFYLTHILDEQTGVVAIATFDRHEHHPKDVIYATHVNYHVISDDGQNYRLDRHVTQTEHGPHMIKEEHDRNPIELYLDLLDLMELQARENEQRRIAQDAGLLTVRFQEVEQIINLLKNI